MFYIIAAAHIHVVMDLDIINRLRHVKYIIRRRTRVPIPAVETIQYNIINLVRVMAQIMYIMLLQCLQHAATVADERRGAGVLAPVVMVSEHNEHGQLVGDEVRAELTAHRVQKFHALAQVASEDQNITRLELLAQVTVETLEPEPGILALETVVDVTGKDDSAGQLITSMLPSQPWP